MMISRSLNREILMGRSRISRRQFVQSLLYVGSGVYCLPGFALQKQAGRSTPHSEPDSALPAQYQAGQGIRYTTEVGGFFKAVQLFRRFHQPGDEQNLRENCERRREALTTEFAFLNNYIRTAEPGGHFAELAMAYETLAQFHSYAGHYEAAIDAFQKAYEIAVAHRFPTGDWLRLRESLGIAELRRGESENCVHGHMAMSCIFPIRPGARHTAPSGSQRAMAHFLACLETAPSDLELKWLLNVSGMTLGIYPHGIPPQHRFNPLLFRSNMDIGHFADIAPALGLNEFQMAGGVIVDDFDGDGFLDVIMSSFDSCESLRYFHNNGDGTFSDRTDEAGLSGQLGGLNIVQTDYNNDGLLDIFVMRGAWELPIRNSLLRNNGNGTFTDVTHDAGLAEPAFQTLSAAWADFDNDGYLDLFLGHENAPNQLFHNNGDGTFTDVSRHAGVDRTACAKGVAVGDYDNDGYPDIYVSNLGAENLLFHNNGNGTFSEVAREKGVSLPLWSFPTWFFDYNNDGLLDLFVSSYSFSLDEVLNSWMGRPVHSESMRLYRNRDNGKFEDVTEEAGLNRVLMPMGSNFGDLCNDGYLDIYLGTGGPSYGSLVPNVLFKNDRGKRFVDITTSSGTGHLQKGHAVAFADLNNDGDQEIVARIGGATPGDRFFTAVFRNPGGHGNHWIAVRLVGVKSNRAAIGARICVTVRENEGEARNIYRWVTSGGSFGCSPLQQHIGIGKAERIEAVEVWWPTSNTRQVFHHLQCNQFIEITEFARTYTVLKRRSFPLPSAADA